MARSMPSTARMSPAKCFVSEWAEMEFIGFWSLVAGRSAVRRPVTTRDRWGAVYRDGLETVRVGRMRNSQKFLRWSRSLYRTRALLSHSSTQDATRVVRSRLLARDDDPLCRMPANYPHRGSLPRAGCR